MEQELPEPSIFVFFYQIKKNSHMSNTPRGNGKPGNRKKEGETWNGYGNNRLGYWNKTIKNSKGEAQRNRYDKN